MATNPRFTGPPIGTAVSKSQWLANHPDVAAYLQQAGVNPAQATGAQYLDALYQLKYLTQVPAGTELQAGHLVATSPNWVFENPWIFPVLGVTAGTAGAVFGGEAAAAETGATATGAGETGAAVEVGATLPSTAIGTGEATLPAGGTGLTGAGLASDGSTLPAAAGPPVSTGGGTPSWLGSVVGPAINTLGQLIATGLTTSAQQEAAAAQQKYLQEALDYAAQQDRYKQATNANRYATLVNNLSPAVQTGHSAEARMAALLGLPAATPSAPNAPPPTYPTPPMPTLNPNPSTGTATPRGAPTTPGTTVTPITGQPTSSPSGVLMRAPTGETQMVDPSLVAHYTQLGAQPVSGQG